MIKLHRPKQEPSKPPSKCRTTTKEVCPHSSASVLQTSAALEATSILKHSSSKGLSRRCVQRLFGKRPSGPIPFPGMLVGYGSSSDTGLVRRTNEDRISMVLHIVPPSNRAAEGWPVCSFFGLYDGHGGSGCAEFLRDHLHQYIVRQSSFPWSPREAIQQGFALAERDFLSLARDSGDESGSCALVVLLVGDQCLIANVGDSRAILSMENGAKLWQLSNDQRPNCGLELSRILKYGGEVYQSVGPDNKLGPHRVYPGKLSVSRTFGDIRAKESAPGVIIAEPEVKSLRIGKESDFIVLGCDGVFDAVSNKEVTNSVWASLFDGKVTRNMQTQAEMAAEKVVKKALEKWSHDNVTAIILCFKNFQDKVYEVSSK